MPKTTDSDRALWSTLRSLDEDLLDDRLTDVLVDEELSALGIDPDSLGRRGVEFVKAVQEEDRLSWRVRAEERRSQLQARASADIVALPDDLDRQGLLARLDELRNSGTTLQDTIKMAARKRKPEESTIEELRALVQEMEILRAIGEKDPNQ